MDTSQPHILAMAQCHPNYADRALQLRELIAHHSFYAETFLDWMASPFAVQASEGARHMGQLFRWKLELDDLKMRRYQEQEREYRAARAHLRLIKVAP